MKLDTAVSVALREASEHAARAEQAQSLSEVQDCGEYALKTLEAIDRSGVRHEERDRKRDSPDAQCDARQVRRVVAWRHAVNLEGGRHDASEAQELIAELLK